MEFSELIIRLLYILTDHLLSEIVFIVCYVDNSEWFKLPKVSLLSVKTDNSDWFKLPKFIDHKFT